MEVIGSKAKRQSILTLMPISIEKLENSSFLECMLDLNFTDVKSLGGVAGVRGHTLYTIDDFYEGVLPLWPKDGEKIAFSNNPTLASRTPQRGGTCSVKPYLTQLKDVLGDEVGNYCKFRMKLAALENYLENTQITLTNKELIISSLNQLNRSALKLHQIGMIDLLELEKLGELSREIKAEIKAVVKSAKEEISGQSVQFSEFDQNFYQFNIRPGKPFAPSEIVDTIKTQYQFPDLTNCDRATLSAFLTKSIEIIKKLCETDHLSNAYEYAARVLTTIPSSASPIWKELPIEELEKLIDIQEVLIDKSSLMIGMKTTSPNEACIHLKCLAITIKVSLSHNILDTELIAFILRRVPTYINRKDLYGGPSSAALSREANTAYSIINEFFKGRQQEKSVSRSSSVFDREDFKSIEQGMKHQEMRYLLEHLEDNQDQDWEDFESIEQRMKHQKMRYLVEPLEDNQELHLLARAMFLILEESMPDKKNKNLSGRGSAIKTQGSKVKDFVLLKKEYIILLYAFLGKGFQFTVTPSHCGVSLDFSRNSLSCRFEIAFDGLRTSSKGGNEAKLIDSQGLTPDEQLIYNSIAKSTLMKNQNQTTGTTDSFEVLGLDLQILKLQIHALELRELFSFFCKPELMIAQLIHFFERYPQRFKNGLFRALFTERLFQRLPDAEASNIQNCMKHSLRRDQLFAFFKRAFKRAEKEKSLGVQCFLLLNKFT